MAKKIQIKGSSPKKDQTNGILEEKEKIRELPSSSDKRFWQDAEITLIDTSKPEESYQPLRGHQWRQQGGFLICNSCPLTHSVYIGIDKQLVGFKKNGEPKIVARKNLSKSL